VTYQYVVTNSGNTPLTDVAVGDDHVTGIRCPQTTLAVGETMTCTGDYTVTESDGTAGSVTNTATAHGRSDGNQVESPPDDVTLPVTPGPSLGIEKSVDDTTVYRAGDEVPYTYTVTNTGSQELVGVGVSDDRVSGVRCGVTTLASGEDTTCTGTYTVTDEDAAAGSVTNTATAHGLAGSTPVVSPPDRATILVASELGLLLEKSADDTRVYRPGDKVAYTYTVTNTGNAPLSSIAVTDDLVPVVTCQDTTLAPQATTTCTGTYTVTEEDAERGTVVNVAAAHGRSEGGTQVESPPDSVSLQAAQGDQALELAKTVDNSRPYQVGDQVTYTYTVTNTGARELTGIAVTDDHVTGVTCTSTTLAPGASTTCTGTYTVTKADAARGGVTNRAFATAENGTVRSNPAQAHIDVRKKPDHGKPCPPKPKPCGYGHCAKPKHQPQHCHDKPPAGW
jgi:uncharacterized repeat protein (TIGR01451 family)/fimbrial isopeptide formation D2 family protein